MAITISKEDNTYSGFCHTINFFVSREGVVSSNGSTTFKLGNQGDCGITQLIFDINALTDNISSLEDYTHMLIFAFNDNNYRAYPLEFQPTEGLDIFNIPNDFTINSGSFNMLLVFYEAGDKGNNAEKQEVFISKQFTGTVEITSFNKINESLIGSAPSYEDKNKFLSKENILITPSEDHYSISIGSNAAGEKFDMLVKRVILTDAGISEKFDDGLDERIAIFGSTNTGEYYAMKMTIKDGTNLGSCWIPEQITSAAGSYEVFLIAQTQGLDTNDENFKRWVSNSVNIAVNDNFLQNNNFITSSDDLVTTNNIKLYSNDNIGLKVSMTTTTNNNSKSATMNIPVVQTTSSTISIKKLTQTFDEVQQLLNDSEYIGDTTVLGKATIIEELNKKLTRDDIKELECGNSSNV